MAGAIYVALGVADTGAMRMLGGQRRRPLHRGGGARRRSRRTVVRLIALSAVGCAILVLFTFQALEIRGLRRDLRDLNTAQQRALAEQAMLRERLARKDDPQVIEDEAREQLGWVLRGEEKVIFVGGEDEE